MAVMCTLNSPLLVSGWLVLALSGVPGTLSAQTRPGEKSSFRSSLVNIEAAASETFRYSTTLANGTGQTRLYDLRAGIPDGWSVVFRVMGTPVTSVNVEAGKSQEIAVELTARPDSKPARYKVPVTAISAGDSLNLNLEAALKGAYALELATPSGRLSEEVTEGSNREVVLTVRNPATLPLENVELSSQHPTGWEVTFEPARIDRLDPGKTSEIKARIKVPEKTIAGDYAATFTAKDSHANAAASFRFIVKTSALSGWIGAVVIMTSVALVYGLIRRYGRR